MGFQFKLNMIESVIIVGVSIGVLGLLTLSFVSKVPAGIGNIINSFTNLQPLLIVTLVFVSFSILLISILAI